MRRMFALLLTLMLGLSLVACGTTSPDSTPSTTSTIQGLEDGVLTVGMECTYAPYNWAQPDDANGAVLISNGNGAYANGYDVMMAKKICEANGWELEIKMMDWDSLVPAVMTGDIDCAIAGQSMTAKRAEQVDFAGHNWAQPDDANGAVLISNGNGAYANGYDVMMAKKICEANGWELEIKMMDWDSLVPAVMTGDIDCAIAGQSMTAKRAEQVDFAGPYLYASIVCVTKSSSPLASATGISQLTGSCTSQRGTIWYDTCLPQLDNVEIQAAQDTAASMIMSVATGMVDFICTDMPTAQGAVIAYPELTILDFSNSDDQFTVSDEDINIGISIRKGNTGLLDAMNAVLQDMTAEDFNAMMAQAVAVQPIE